MAGGVVVVAARGRHQTLPACAVDSTPWILPDTRHHTATDRLNILGLVLTQLISINQAKRVNSGYTGRQLYSWKQLHSMCLTAYRPS